MVACKILLRAFYRIAPRVITGLNRPTTASSLSAEEIAITPAIQLVTQRNIEHTVHQYAHDPAADSYGSEAATALGLPESMVFKTLVVELDCGELAVGIVPVASMLSTKAMAKALGAKKAAMADKQKVSRVTGYVLGGVSPLAQKKQLRTLIDDSAKNLSSMHVSAGRRGLEIELAPADLLDLCAASFADIKQP